MIPLSQRIDQNGRIYLPVDIRNKLDVQKGDWIEIHIRGLRSFARISVNHLLIDELTRKTLGISQGDMVFVELQKHCHVCH